MKKEIIINLSISYPKGFDEEPLVYIKPDLKKEIDINSGDHYQKIAKAKMERMLKLMMKYKMYKEDKIDPKLLEKVEEDLDKEILYKDYEKDSSYIDTFIADDLWEYATDDKDEYFKLNTYGIEPEECIAFIDKSCKKIV